MKYIKTIMILGVFFAFPVINSQDNSDEIEEVVTVSAKQPVPIDKVVGSVAVISQDEIEARLVSDVSQLLENTIGITVPKDISSGRSRNSDVVIRGVKEAQVLELAQLLRQSSRDRIAWHVKDLRFGQIRQLDWDGARNGVEREIEHAHLCEQPKLGRERALHLVPLKRKLVNGRKTVGVECTHGRG